MFVVSYYLPLGRHAYHKGRLNDSYTTAVATVQRTDTPFNYKLVITRAYQEGEAELFDDYDDEEGESHQRTPPSTALFYIGADMAYTIVTRRIDRRRPYISTGRDPHATRW